MHTGHERTPQCQALLEQLSDYIEGELEDSLCAVLEEHLAGCHDCRVLVDTTRKTVVLYRQHNQASELPQEVGRRLWQALEQAGCGPTDQD